MCTKNNKQESYLINVKKKYFTFQPSVANSDLAQALISFNNNNINICCFDDWVENPFFSSMIFLGMFQRQNVLRVHVVIELK